MSDIKSLETLLYKLHDERVRCEADSERSQAQLESLWQRIIIYEAELEAARLAAGWRRPG
ncbi:MAG: hypothetical protein PHT88_04910 [Candidatus Moranbacteria bacterium]|nr:hypothetical protein [Candidatus Moranbacteria bacterium]